MPASEWVQTGLAALLFALAFLVGGRLHPLRAVMSERSAVSFSAGMAAAYVFVHVLPELAQIRTLLTRTSPMELPYEGAAAYFVALIGFLTFYGLDHLQGQLRGRGRQDGAFRLHVGGFAAYAGLVGYLLVHGLEDSPQSRALFTVAFAVHFMTVAHALAEMHGARYARAGRYVLAAMSIAGWAAGLVFTLSPALIGPLLAFISGAVILNSALTELPSEADGRFAPFVCGGLLYGAILLPLS
jgi:hypothetical protein